MIWPTRRPLGPTLGHPSKSTWCQDKAVHNSPTVTDRYLTALALSVVVLGGCGGEDNRSAKWSYISPAIIQPNCATGSCHSKTAAVAGLDLSDTDIGYDGLTKQKVTGVNTANSPRPLVTPGNPVQSRIMNMMLGVGARLMPPDRPLAGADIELVEKWILDGAKND
jgi:hypothetical protein